MLRTALKTVFAHKLRLLLTALSVMMGVAFIAGTFIFTDTINSMFNDLFDDLYEGQDILVQQVSEVDVGFGEPAPIDESVVGTVSSVPGVEIAEGSVGGTAILYDKDGEAIIPMGPPTLGGSMTDDERVAGATEIREGRLPVGPREINIDAGTAEANDLVVGDVIKVQTPKVVDEYEIVGIIGFGMVDNIGGATWTGFDYETAQTVLGLEDQVTQVIVVVEEGANIDVVTAAIAAQLPDGIGAIRVADEVADQQEAMQEGLGFMTTGLLIFGLVSVFVAAFIIQNTFRIIVRQRQKELALMRAVGATGSQVIWMVVIEAIIVGVVASVLGIAAGFLISQLLTALMGAIGWDIAATNAPLAARTIFYGLAVGLGVTVASAVLPAIRAARIPPVAALQDVDVQLRMSDRKRTIFGSIVMAAGLALILNGLFGDILDFGPLNELTAVGVGALLVFLAVSILSSMAVRPIARFLGAPLPRLDNLTGTLAVGNSVRKPRRTATTASALMIGLALVSFIFILGDSIKASSSAAIEESLRADYVVGGGGFGLSGFSPALGEELAEAPELEAVTALRFGFWDRDGSEDFLMGVDEVTLDKTIGIGLTQGSIDALSDGGVLVYEDVVDEEALQLGDEITMGFATTGFKQVEVVGVFSDAGVVGVNYLVGMDFYEANFGGYGTDVDYMLAVKAADGVALADSRAAVDAVAADFPNATVNDQAEYRKSQEDAIDQLLLMLNALLALAVIIAVFGITNTLALSIFERTREIGLLRAVGMNRPQIRRMIRWEAIIVAIIGTILGIVVGLFFGVVVTAALASQGIDKLSIPAVQIVGLVLFGAIAGLLAAIVPARRAAKLNILEAIAYE